MNGLYDIIYAIGLVPPVYLEFRHCAKDIIEIGNES